MERLRVTRVLALCLAMACLFLPQLAWGQQVTAAITGIVTDPSGAPVAGAAVTAKDVDRGTVWTTQTNTEGAYNLPRLPVGSYEVRVGLPGFQTAVHAPMQLVLNQIARMDFQMVIGQVTQTLEVTSEAPLLQTEATQLGTVIDSQTVGNLPMASRNYNQLTLLAAGAVTISPGTFTSATATGFGANGDTASRPYINGNHEQANNYVLDGVDNNQVSDNLLGYVPNADAIQEFNMITQNAPAEFGNFQGGIINVTMKGGTNRYHGTLFEFLRNDKLNANSWENNFTIVNGAAAPRSVLRWNQFGGTVGGPILKNKLFFFADYQGLRYDVPASAGTTSVLTQAERGGDFSAMLQGGNHIQLTNPFADGAPFPGNRIPLSMLSPVASNLFSSKWYPFPNTTGSDNGLNNNYVFSNGNRNSTDQGDIRIDYDLSGTDRIFARYSRLYTNDPGTTTWTLGFNPVVTDDAHHGVLDWTHTLGSSIVNEARFGVNYVVPFNGFNPAANVGNLGQQIGIANGNLAGPGLLALNFGGGFLPGKGGAGSYGSNVTGAYQLFGSTVGQLEDTVVITKGRHTIHTGFQIFRDRIDAYYAGNNGNIGIVNLTGVYTGTGESDFFLGLANSFDGGPQTQATWGQRASIYAGFVQDDFRVSKNLILNIGFRYENHTPWVEVDNRQASFGLYSGQIYVAGHSCPYSNCRALYNNYNGLGNYQPRLGVAWTPQALRGKTVVRAAYGTSEFLEGTGTNLRLTMNPPTYQPNFHNANPSTLGAGGTQPYPLSIGPTPPPINNAFAGAELRLWDPNMQPATIQQWSVTVQQELTPTMTLSASYVGQHGVHLTEPMNYGQRVWLGTAADGSAITGPSPYLSGNPTLQNEAGLIVGTAPAGSQRYNALQATLQKRFSNGLQFQVAYTWSKCMSNNAGYYGTWSGNSQSYFSNEFWDNVYDGSREWGPCFFDQTQNLTAYAVYEVPFGKGRPYGRGANPILNAVAGGWNVDPVVTMHTGFPMSPFTWAEPSGTGSEIDPFRPDCAVGAGNYSPQTVAGGVQWFNPDPNAFPIPSGRFGNCGNDALRGPGGKQLDLSLQKDFAITEGKKLEFRADFINFTNTKMLAHPNLFVGGGFGLITVTANTPRNIQFGLKFYF